jgi:hypothetical protein
MQMLSQLSYRPAAANPTADHARGRGSPRGDASAAVTVRFATASSRDPGTATSGPRVRCAAMDGLGVRPRRLGAALLLFGLVGVVLAVIVAAGLIAGAIAARDLDDTLEADQASIAAALDRLTDALDAVGTTADNASTSLGTASGSMSDAGAMLDQLAVLSDDMATTLEIQILGTQPFATVSPRFRELAVDARTLRDDAAGLAGALDTNAADVTALADRIARIGDEVDAISKRVTAFDRTEDLVRFLVGGIALAGLLVAWLGIAAAACMWAGWRIRRRAL